jgi:hypothetical protein
MQFKHTVEFEETRFYQTHGLPSCSGLEHVRVVGSRRELLDADLPATPLGFADRVASWERLRTFGRLPLFATSLSALVAIPVVFYIFALYNDQLLRLQERADQLLRLHERAAQSALASDTALVSRIEQILARVEETLRGLLAALHPIPVPSLSFWLLLSTVLLGIASTLFALLCPSRVREFSLDRWTDELRQSAIQYLPISWSRRCARTVAGPCYPCWWGRDRYYPLNQSMERRTFHRAQFGFSVVTTHCSIDPTAGRRSGVAIGRGRRVSPIVPVSPCGEVGSFS